MSTLLHCFVEQLAHHIKLQWWCLRQEPQPSGKELAGPFKIEQMLSRVDARINQDPLALPEFKHAMELVDLLCLSLQSGDTLQQPTRELGHLWQRL
eukprot:1160026-Pelagomonas_calceolata.AAC.7